MKVEQEEKEKEAAKAAKQKEIDSKKEVIKLASRPVSAMSFFALRVDFVCFVQRRSFFFSALEKMLLRTQEERSITSPAGEPGLVDRNREARTAFARLLFQ